MATEYKLSYTASEIDEKLKKVDNIQDGTSVTVSSVIESTADGGSNVIIFSDGKTVTIKNGSTGATGAPGIHIGSEPPTDSDIMAWIDPDGVATDHLQLTPEFANSVAELEESGDTSKLYVLPDGYIYAYISKTVEGGTTEVVKNITDGFSDDYCLSVSSGGLTALSGYVTTPFIDFSQYPIDAEIRLSGIDWAADVLTNGYASCIYDESQSMLDAMYSYLGKRQFGKVNATVTASSNNNVTLKVANTQNALNFQYIKFCGKGTSASAVVQVVYTEEAPSGTVTEWANTGIAFIPADYEDRIIELEKDSASHEARIALLESNDDISGVPDYWIDELETKSAAIQQAMESAGQNKSAFLWYTDSHWKYTNAKVSPYLLDYLYKHTSMNKVNFGGDIVSDPDELTHDKISYVYEWRRMVKSLPKHHSVIGNHDNLHKGRDDSDVSSLVYAFLLAAEETSDMVIGSDFYYYIDDSCEKTRYLYLDSGRFSLSDDETKFIIDSLVTVPDSWHVVVISHIWFQYSSPSAPTVGSINTYMQKVLDLFDAYNARQNGTITMVNTAYPYDFSACGGKVEFCIGGHIHVDYDLTSDGGIPVIITASDTNQARGTNATACGTVGTVTESAVFGIIADYNSNKITVVGVGRGTSREITY